MVFRSLHEKQPDATVAYVLPNATVGYQLGYGAVLDVYPQGTSGVARRTRIVVMAAHPGRWHAEIKVDFPYPRRSDLRATPEFQAKVNEVSQRLHEVEVHA